MGKLVCGLLKPPRVVFIHLLVACGFVPCPLSVEEVVHWIVVIPLSVEVIEFCWYPSSERLILCWLCA